MGEILRHSQRKRRETGLSALNSRRHSLTLPTDRFAREIEGILTCAVSLIPRSPSQTGAVLKQTAGLTAYLNAKASEGQEHAARQQDMPEGV